MQNNLPSGFEKLKSEKKYINLGKLPEGEYRFRIVDRPIAGWLDWMDKKPCRFKPEDKPKTSFDPNKPVKSFWAMQVWDYSKSDLFVMEVTQNSIKKTLEELGLNEDWGDLTSFDIKIKKEGSGMDTEYFVTPVPHKPLSKEIKDAIESTPVRLEALYEGKDPWKDLTPSEPVSKHITEDQLLQVLDLIQKLGDPKAEEFICKRVSADDLSQIPSESFDGIVKYLNKRLEEKK